jgi:hypothetical protein
MSVNIQETFQRMPLGDKIILPAGIVLLIDSFLKWYSAEVCFLDVCVSGSANAWEAPGAIWSILAVLIGLLLSAGVAAVHFGNVKLPALPEGLTWARVDLGLAVAAGVFLLIKLLNHSGDLAFGFFIGIICVAALIAGAYLNFQAEREGGSTTTTTGA